MWHQTVNTCRRESTTKCERSPIMACMDGKNTRLMAPSTNGDTLLGVSSEQFPARFSYNRARRDGGKRPQSASYAIKDGTAACSIIFAQGTLLLYLSFISASIGDQWYFISNRVVRKYTPV